MPSRLVKLLASDGETKAMNTIDSTGRLKRTQVCANQTDGIVPVLAQLLRQDSGTQYAYLCGEAVKHVSKLSGEGKLLSEEVLLAIPNTFRWLLRLS